VSEAEVLPEVTSVTVVCPEGQSYVRIRDVHAYVLSIHERVCPELVEVNGEPR
jgi:hypothetical protein